jgi:hypothetical protein
MRLQGPENVAYAHWLLGVGSGALTTPGGLITLPDHVRCRENTISCLIDTIYPAIDAPGTITDDWLLQRTILSARNDDVDTINSEVLAKTPGGIITFQSADSVQRCGEDDYDAAEYSVETLNSITLPGMPLAKLELKLGCPLMILRNLDPPNGVCNGTRAILLQVGTRTLKVQILKKGGGGGIALIPRLDITPSDTALPFIFKRHQFPVRLAYAMTINKSQGQSVDNVGLDPHTPVFTHGELYVALSRMTSAQCMKAVFPEGAEESTTSNVVYPEVLLRPPQVSVEFMV